jgi:ORF6N domain
MHAPDSLTGRIHLIRGVRVVLDSDLARLYGVETRRLNEQVRRNRRRFPAEFMFQLNNQELARLMSQFATSNGGRGGMRKPPLAFTEHGVIMAAAVLNSPRAMEVSVYVVRAFVQLRDTLSANAEIARRLDQLERKFGAHDRAILEILQALRQLTQPVGAPKRRRIGFVQD